MPREMVYYHEANDGGTRVHALMMNCAARGAKAGQAESHSRNSASFRPAGHRHRDPAVSPSNCRDEP